LSIFAQANSIYTNVGGHLRDTTDNQMEIDKAQEILNDFSTRHQLVDRAVDGCKVALENLIKGDGGQDELGGHDLKDLILEFNGQSLIFKSYQTENPFIRTEIGVYIKDPDNVWVRGLEPIGKYELDTDLSAEDIDDWLTIDNKKLR